MPKQSDIRKKFPFGVVIRILVSHHALRNAVDITKRQYALMRGYELAVNYPYSSTPLMKNEDAVGVVHGFKMMEDEPIINSESGSLMHWVQCTVSMTKLTHEALADGLINFRYVSFDGVDEDIIAFFMKETLKVGGLSLEDKAGFKLCMMGLRKGEIDGR